MKNKNIKLLKDFEKYCKQHPEERFWQALRNWSKANKILFSKSWEGLYHDTFYFEGKDK